jgi:outer membrane protein OmpA-like peptidoglycan-associated protein
MLPSPPPRFTSLPARAQRLLPAAAVVVVAALAGCGSVPPSSPTPPPAAPAVPPRSALDQRSGVPAALGAERQWLQQWFRDTPVLVRGAEDGSLRVEVPREFCFDPGASTIKPPLGAVLDKVAESLRRVPLARVPVLTAPDDAAGGNAALALQRAAQVRQRLVQRGVAVVRLGRPSASSTDRVALRLEAVAD